MASSKKDTGKTVDKLYRGKWQTLSRQSHLPASLPTTTPLQSQELPELNWSGYDTLDQATRQIVEAATRDIQQRLKRTLQDIYYIGKHLSQVREILTPIRGAFSNWVQEEFEVKYGLTVRLSEHWMNIAKRFSEEQIRKFIELKLPLSALYQVAAPSTPDGAADKIINTIETTFPYVRYRKVPRTLVVQLVREHKKEAERALKQAKLQEAGLIPEVQGILLSSPVAEDATEIRWLAQFEPTIQSKIAEKLSTGKAKTIWQANSQLEVELSDCLNSEVAGQSEHKTIFHPAGLAEGQQQTNIVEEFGRNRGLKVQFDTLVTYHPGPWQILIQQVQAESIDFCFVETPLELDCLTIYSDLAQQLFRVLKPGAKAAITVGQRNIQFIGSMLEPPLQVSGTHIVQPHTGSGPLALGSNGASGPMLMSLVHREPAAASKRLMQDIYNAPELEINLALGLEETICCCLQRYTNQRDTILHVIIDPQFSFNISSIIIESAQKLHYGQLIGIGIDG